jgi:hypothetical protein
MVLSFYFAFFLLDTSCIASSHTLEGTPVYFFHRHDITAHVKKKSTLLEQNGNL